MSSAVTGGLRLVNADWNFWPDGFDPFEIWHTCARLGFVGMELGVYRAGDELSAAGVSAVEGLVRETGLGVEAVLFSMPAERWPDGGLASPEASARAVAEITETARRAAGLGAGVLGVWPGADAEATGDGGAGWARTLDAIDTVAGVAGPLGLSVAVEYKPGQLIAGATEALRLVDEIDRPGVGVLVDTAHALAAGEDLAALPDRLGDRLVHVHLGDSGGDADADLPPGAVHDFVPFLRGLDATGYPGALSFDLYGSVQAGLTTGTRASEQGLAYIRGALATAAT
ncbi:MAG: sugar phosphate isomerase/epimerase family protein [Acidimicrobiales bacterium]